MANTKAKPMAPMRVCTRCGVLKIAECFYPRRGNREGTLSGRLSYCDECSKAYSVMNTRRKWLKRRTNVELVKKLADLGRELSLLVDELERRECR